MKPNVLADVRLCAAAEAHRQPWILLVESNYRLRRLLGELLQGMAACDVHAVGDGMTALEIMAAEASPPSLAVLDWDSPRVNGDELLRAMRQRHATLAAVFTVTSDPPYELLFQARTRFIWKPFGIDELASEAVKALAARGAQSAVVTTLRSALACTRPAARDLSRAAFHTSLLARRSRELIDQSAALVSTLQRTSSRVNASALQSEGGAPDGSAENHRNHSCVIAESSQDRSHESDGPERCP